MIFYIKSANEENLNFRLSVLLEIIELKWEFQLKRLETRFF